MEIFFFKFIMFKICNVFTKDSALYMYILNQEMIE